MVNQFFVFVLLLKLTLSYKEHSVNSASSPPQTTITNTILKYEIPDKCEMKFLNADEVSLKCQLTITSDITLLNFTSIPSTEHITSLYLHCDRSIFNTNLTSILHNSKNNNNNNNNEHNFIQNFINFNRLREVVIINCKLFKFPSNTLYAVTELRNLTLKTFNIPSVTLEIEPFTFLHSKLLEKIDLSYNNLKNIPELLFCPLKNLFLLNISHNKLQDIKDLSFNSEDEIIKLSSNHSSINNNSSSTGKNIVTGTRYICNLNIQILDLSFNNFKHLSSKSLSSLRRLHELKFNNNDLKLVSDTALNGLATLRKFDISNNHLVALPSTLFQDNLDIREIYLQNNSLVTLANGLFSKLEQLLILDLSNNQLTSSTIDSLTFSGLIRLVLLNLSYNRITILNTYYFKDLYTLQILNLEHNLLEKLSPDTFSPMNNLHTLILSYNKITILEADSFRGLYAMSLLSLDNNMLSTLHKDSLRNCSALQDLNLNGNLLTKIPSALQNMRLLRNVDLGENTIEQLDEPSFKGMNNLNGLRLISNDIKHISNTAFADLLNLQILNLCRNKIKTIESKAFENNKNLQAVRIDGNLLTNISNLFSHCHSLIYLNISDNQIDEFDYSMIPMGLQWLYLQKNKINAIGTLSSKTSSKLKLQSMDLSFNSISKININSFPSNIELILLNDNIINSIDINSFVGKLNLTRVDLYSNQIINMDLNALRLSPVSEKRSLPEFYIGGNPFQCDCTMEWLQRINSLEHIRQYPKILDIENIYCKLPYSRELNFIPLLEAQSSHFVCEYKIHCFALCRCCDFNACDCEMTCPINCTCYHDQSWSAANIVDCSLTNYHKLPGRIPMDATQVYLDGNNFGELTSFAFIGRKNLRVLYINDSNVNTIHNSTFNGLKKLQKMHLENNNLQELYGFEFTSLEEIREIYLHNNKLKSIQNQTFSDLKLLEVLTLDGNRLHLFPVWHLSINPYLVRVTLANNNWSCHCQYLKEFRSWLRINFAKVTDAGIITCVLRFQQSGENTDLKQLGPHLADFNSSACSSYLSGVGYLDSYYNAYSSNQIILTLIVITSLFITLTLIFTIAYNRRKLRGWLYTKCTVKLCYSCTKHASASALEENDLCEKTRPFDAYISYSIKDESFVNQVLVPRLETQQYRLRLHHKDASVCSYVADTILEGVESSSRTIIVLSTQFLSSEWYRFEFKSAFREAMQRDMKYNKLDKNIKRLIIIIFGDLPSRDLDPDMRVYLNKTAVCIKWGDSRFWEKLRHAMPTISNNIQHLNNMDSTGTKTHAACLRGDAVKGSLYYWCKQAEDAGSSTGGRSVTLGRPRVPESPRASLPDCCEPSPGFVMGVRSMPRGSRHLQQHQRGSVWA